MKELAIQSEFSDGIKLESQTQRVFQVSMDDDLEEGLRYTVGIWLELINKITSDKAYVVNIAEKAVR